MDNDSREDDYKEWYDIINRGLLRLRKTGSFDTKKPLKTPLNTGSFIPFDQLPDYDEFDPNYYFGPNSPYASRKDRNGQIIGPEKVLSDKEREQILAADFEVARVHSYKDLNEHREREGLTPWYILTKEELHSVGLFLPYSLSINPRREYVAEMIRQEGLRLRELQAKGVRGTPWSTWKDHSN